MNEHEAHVQRVEQIEQLLPELLHPQPGVSCLYVGATPRRFQLGRELHEAGYALTLLEVDRDNWYFYLDHPWLTGGCIHGDVRQLPADRVWDTIVWWHGPEHIALDDLEPTLRKLEAAATKLVVLAAPWGENAQPIVEGNAHQEHKAHLQPEDFQRLGYETATRGVQGDLATWPHILAWRFVKQQRVVYTALLNGYDDLRPIRHSRTRCVCFSEQPLKVEGWENIVVGRRFGDPVREARMYKCLAHQWFPNIQESLWIDGSCELLVEPDVLFDYLDGVDIAMPRHPSSKTLAEEADLVIRLGKADSDAVHAQMARYGRDDLPVGATGWLLRRHKSVVAAVNNAWWGELTVHTLRDQLSLPYCLAQSKANARLIDVNLYDNALVRVHEHRSKP